MSNPTRTVVTISGTNRPDNYTTRALALVDDEFRRHDITVRNFDARELTLAFPGLPTTDDAKELTEAVRSAQAVVLASPEYHGTFAAMTKLIIENLGFPSALKGKPVALLGVASGRIGAIKTLEQLRSVCGHMGALVLPNPVSVAGVRTVFEADGTCTDASVEEMVRSVATTTIDFMHDYVCPRYELESAARNADGPAWSSAL